VAWPFSPVFEFLRCTLAEVPEFMGSRSCRKGNMGCPRGQNGHDADIERAAMMTDERHNAAIRSSCGLCRLVGALEPGEHFVVELARVGDADPVGDHAIP
jgi:hypothetical protein